MMYSRSPPYPNESFYNEQGSRNKNYRQESLDLIKHRLSQNLSQIVELCVQRKDLMMKLTEMLLSENKGKLEHIAKAKNNQLRNQARLIKDQTILTLIDNADRYGNKGILNFLADINIPTLQNQQSKKYKNFHDEIKRIEGDRTILMNRFKVLDEEVMRLNDEQRKLFRQIEALEAQLVNVLMSKQYDHIKIAEKIQDQIEKRKLLLKNNKTAKDKKKLDMSHEIQKIMDIIKKHEQIAVDRFNQIQAMYGGYESLEEFDHFFRSFQTVVANKIQAKKEDENVLRQVVRRANLYERLVQDIQKQASEEAYFFDLLAEAFKKNLTLALLERAYLSNIPNDRNFLMGLVQNCRVYRGILQRLTEEKSKAKWETDKAQKVMDHFQPILKTINTQVKRKDQLREKISRIMTTRNQLQKMQKNNQSFEFMMTNLFLKKEAILQPLQQAARKGNLQEYKQKSLQLQKVQQQIANFSQTKNDQKLKQQQARLNVQIQQLNRQYSDIIQEILVGQKQMTCFTFLQKLSKRLMLV